MKTTDLAHSFRERPASRQSAKESGSWVSFLEEGRIGRDSEHLQKGLQKILEAVLVGLAGEEEASGLLVAVASSSGHHPTPTADTVARQGGLRREGRGQVRPGRLHCPRHLQF